MGEIIGSIVGSKKKDKYAMQAKDAIWNMYQETKENLTPWLEAGKEGLSAYSQEVLKGPGEYSESPEYKWLRDQGLRSFNKKAAASGTLGGGAYDKGLMAFNQNFALQGKSNFLRDYYNRVDSLGQLSNTGLNTANQLGQFGQNAANSVAGIQMQRGQNKANMWNGIGRGIDSGIGFAFGGGFGGGGASAPGTGLSAMNTYKFDSYGNPLFGSAPR